MKKNHKREILLARMIFAGFLVLIAMAIALAVMLISSHMGRDVTKEPKTSEKASTVTEKTTETDVVQVPKETETQKATEEQTEAVVLRWTTSNVNFRKKASTEGDVIETLDKGVEVEWLEESDGWVQIRYDGKEGYVRADYLTDENPNGGTGEDSDKKGSDKDNSGETKDEGTSGQTKGNEKAAKKIVVIDPGHQSRGDSSKEPNGPGSTTMKARVTDGTAGVATGVPEYQLNLDVSLLLRDELQKRGYQVEMTRTTNDVNISNKERAEFANEANADIAVRIHANSVDDSSVRGALTVSPSKENPYVSDLYEESMKLSSCILDAYCAAAGIRKRSCTTDDGMTGINWSTVPVTIVELGFMSNGEEDSLMQDTSVQKKMAEGIADGIDQYFGF